MRVDIEQVANNYVYFATKYGKGKGIWKDSAKPEEKEYFVEFDIETVYHYDDMCVCGRKEYQINICNNQNMLTMQLIEYDESGCAAFQLGESIVEIETVYDKRFMTLLNLYMTLVVENLNKNWVHSPRLAAQQALLI